MDAITKVEEKSEQARKEFFKKVDHIKQGAGSKASANFVQDVSERAAAEYNKLFGRMGMRPLLHLKGGKKRPRVVMERDELWVIYKPALWQMGGNTTVWKRNVDELVVSAASLQAAEGKMLNSDQPETLQEWQGLMQGQLWIDPKQEVKQWGFIQRLDMETDGPVVAAKTWRAQRCLQAQMRDHVFNKAYLCLVHGRLENKIQFVKKKFAEIGSTEATSTLLEHDPIHDPFYDWTQSGVMDRKRVRKAETFVKPIAYYKRQQDGTEYSLCYVNILTGITHQIRITMQSLGHPLVSDDRYLPKDQALADLKWCPRNFLCEVRQDWWDMCGPYKDEKRRRFTRINIENPLPLLFQGILENKLVLVEKLDATADLNVGCRYWALGDEQLMAAYPKDEDFRQKVTRWGQRNRIHLDAIDRLLLLPKEEIDEVLNNYRAPSENTEVWTCSNCMMINLPDPTDSWKPRKGGGKGGANKWDDDPDRCNGGAGEKCEARRMMDEGDFTLPNGWMNYTADPTIHLLFQVNKRWLEARRKILKSKRPNWERPPEEETGTPCEGMLLKNLEDALSLNAKAVGHGICEHELAEKVPGCDGIKLPLGEPPEDSKVRRVRLPGRGTGSQWTYCLKGKDLAEIVHKSELSVKTKKLTAPVDIREDTVPSNRINKREAIEKAKRADAAREKHAKRKAEMEVEEKRLQEDTSWAFGKSEALMKQQRQEHEEDVQEAKARREKSAKEAKEAAAAQARGRERSSASADAGPAAKRRRTGSWQRLESKSNPGSFYYWNEETKESRVDRPPDFEDDRQANGSGAEPQWSRLESKSNPGKFYYHNAATGENSVERPAGVTRLKEDQEAGIAWERRESTSRPGHFYYFNPTTGENEIHPPRVDPPWKLMESKTKKGQFYYFNEETNENTVHPPRSARPSKAPARAAAGAAAGAQKAAASQPPAGKDDKLPQGWEKKSSSQHPGKFYYVNAASGETVWQKPVWERTESTSNPGKVYWKNVQTGETSWTDPSRKAA